MELWLFMIAVFFRGVNPNKLTSLTPHGSEHYVVVMELMILKNVVFSELYSGWVTFYSMGTVLAAKQLNESYRKDSWLKSVTRVSDWCARCLKGTEQTVFLTKNTCSCSTVPVSGLCEILVASILSCLFLLTWATRWVEFTCAVLFQ